VLRRTKYQSSETNRAVGILSSPQEWVVLPVPDGAMIDTPKQLMSIMAPCTE